MSKSGGRGIWAVLVANLRASPAKSAVLGMGAIVLVVLLVRLAGGGKPEAAEAALALVPPAAEITAVAIAAAPMQAAPVPRRPRPRMRQMPAARDPFSLGWLGASVGAGTAEEAPAELTLQLIMTAGDQDKGLAVISGVVVHPGSTIGRHEVVQIAERYVVLRDSTGTLTLRMP